MNTGHQLTIHLDLDGVLADFELLLFQRYNLRVKSCTDEEMWSAINQYEDDGSQWFYDLEPMADAQLLWDFVKQYNPRILTATGRAGDIAGRQKIKWVQRHFDIPADRVVYVRKSEDKAQYCTGPRDILIDDNYERCILPWTQAGGTGILHSNARLTIEELQYLIQQGTFCANQSIP